MNKILLLDDNIDVLTLDDSVECKLILKNSLFQVNTLKINILKDTDISISSKILNSSKLNVDITVFDNVKCNIYDFKEGVNSKVKYQYNINENSILNIYKFYDLDSVKEFVKVDLNKEGATINYYFKTISKASEKYDLTIYHNEKNTNSNIINNGVNIHDGNLTFNVSSFVSNNNTYCNVIQNSRIINLTDNKCQICPNLYIDEYDVNASHSAHIGSFKEDELFYLMSRGINKEEATYLLIKGFLMDNADCFKEEISNICEKYWR